MERANLEQWKAREVARLLALVETERRYYQDIIAALPVGLLVLSKDLSILSANRSVKRIFGLRTGDSLRGRLDSLLPGWLLDRVERVLKTGAAEMGIPLVTDLPEGRHLQISIQAIHDWEESPGQEALLTIEDVTELTASRPPSVPATVLPLPEPTPAPIVAPELPPPPPPVELAREIEPTVEAPPAEVVPEPVAVPEAPALHIAEEPLPAPAPPEVKEVLPTAAVV